MSDNNSPLDDLIGEIGTQQAKKSESPQTAKKRGLGRSQKYRSALTENQTDRRKTALATGKGSSVAGKFIRRSFTYRPDQLDSIEALSAQMKLSKNDLIRWFVDMGIESVNRGEQPPITQEIRHRYDPNS